MMAATQLQIAQTINCPKDAKDIIYSPSGRYLAVSCSDGHIQLYSPSLSPTNAEIAPVHTLKPHESTVWASCFTPSEFGTVLASCSSDRSVVIQKENMVLGEWQVLYVDNENEAIVKSVEFCKSPGAPLSIMQNTASQYAGLHLAAAALDGTVTVYSLQTDHNWSKIKFKLRFGGANVVRWCPQATVNCATGASADPGHILAVGGQDGRVHLYQFAAAQELGGGAYVCKGALNGHRRAVVDVAWMPSSDSSSEVKLASLSDDGTVIVWGKAAHTNTWSKLSVHAGVAPAACRLNWNFDGTNLATITPQRGPNANPSAPPILLI